MIPFEQMGLQNISAVSSDIRPLCDFRTMTVVQTADRFDKPLPDMPLELEK